jgi:hypothetical protein
LEDAEIARLIGGAPRLTLEDIVAHPRLPEARKLFIDRFLEVYGGDPFLVRLLIESGRICIFIIAILLEAGQDPANRDTWFTVGRLKQQMAMFGIASARHVDDLIARLSAVGYLEVRPSEQDRRVRILKTTAAMRTHHRDWVAAHYAPLTVIYPQYDYSLALRRDPTFQTIYARTAVPFLPLGAKMHTAVPEIMVFLNHAGGFMVMATLLQAAMAEGHLHAAVPYADVGDRFGISRTQVRKLLMAAQDIGLVKLHARGGHRVEILPKLWECGDRGMAGGMFIHDMVYVMAAAQFAAVPRPWLAPPLAQIAAKQA